MRIDPEVFARQIYVSPAIATDSYKPSHRVIYPPNAEYAESYFEARKTSRGLGNQYIDTLIAFGALNYLLPQTLRQVTMGDLDEAQEHWRDHFGTDAIFGKKDWEIIVNKYGGYMPLKVDALPEGMPVPINTMLMRVRNTDSHGLVWLPNWFETELSHMWYPVTVASISRQGRDILLKWLNKTGDPSLIDFKLHDFGYRGASSRESAMVGGLAHLVNFLGSDTSAALRIGRTLYKAGGNIGYSIPATEHSTITSWGRENEALVYETVLDKYPTGLVACVSDSYNIYHACEYIWGELLRDKVLSRDGVLIIRPDSGVPRDVCLKVMEILGAKFGFTVNAKGYKVLHPKVRVIQGDGVDLDAIDDICEHLANHGWSIDNIAFGMGGGLLQKCNRDTFSFTFKMCYMAGLTPGIFGKRWERDVYKDPVDDQGKMSKRGRQVVVLNMDGEPITTTPFVAGSLPDIMRNVYLNGEFFNQDDMATIRARARVLDEKILKAA